MMVMESLAGRDLFTEMLMDLLLRQCPGVRRIRVDILRGGALTSAHW